MRVVSVGHVTNDQLADGTHPGGGALYAGLAAAALGAEVTLVTRAGVDFVGSHLFTRFHRVHALSAPRTTAFDERYTGEQRVVRLLARASEVNAPLPAADVVLLCPVAQEVPDAALAARPARLLAAGLQGWLRAFSPDGHAMTHPLADAGRFAGCDVVSCSAEDLEGLGADPLEELRASVRVVAVTDGASGARLYSGGQGWRVAALPVVAVDPTGAGDVFLATLALELARGAPLLEAARWACCAGALTVTSVGPTGIEKLKTLPDALERYAREAPPPQPLL
jgi:sugar/nucleoside kinase (ribokinase family)